jgi:hypothetical protein
VALRLAQPLDGVHQRLTAATDLPPLWLRQHVGPIARYKRAQGEIVAYLACPVPIHRDHTALDIRTRFTELLERARLRVVSRDLGRWFGGASAPNYQDLLVLARA